MDPRLLDYYDRELRHLAGMCGEFARAYPKIAGRLSLEGFIKEFQCPDPYVERLLEGFAYMAARVQLKVDAEYPRFTQALLDMVYPDYLAPVPSMGIVQFRPDLRQGSLNAGVEIGRGTALRSLLGKDDQTACEYSTAHAVTLWPLSTGAADYLPSPAALAAVGLASSPGKAALISG
jgi:type VI secretion system protein ImpG